MNTAVITVSTTARPIATVKPTTTVKPIATVKLTIPTTMTDKSTAKTVPTIAETTISATTKMPDITTFKMTSVDMTTQSKAIVSTVRKNVTKLVTPFLTMPLANTKLGQTSVAYAQTIPIKMPLTSKDLCFL